MVLADENASSSASNRILTNTGSDLTLSGGESATIWYDYASSRDDLGNKLTFDIDHGYAMIAGVVTTNMPGWDGYTADHIIAVIGYKINTSFDDTRVYYSTFAHF